MKMTQTDSTSRWLSVEQAAQYLGCSRNFLDKDRISKLHGIPFTKLGRNIRYDRFLLDAFMEANSTTFFQGENNAQ